MKKYKQREYLTNEYINKSYTDNFALALASIESARDLIKSGKEFNLQALLSSIGRQGELRREEQLKIEIEHEAL